MSLIGYDKINQSDDYKNTVHFFFYDKNGRAQKDIDYTDHGNPKEHPQVPHEHKWDWSNPNNPKRSKTDD